MSSRFVPAGGDQDSNTGDVDWEKARQEVDNQRNAKPIVSGKQEDGKSLYEVLQANKAAKQDAFEEAAKLRNQFRALDDSEVEFLESIRQSELVKENSVKQETAEQLEMFRKQRIAAEQAASEAETTVATIPIAAKDSWTNVKKRRRDDNNKVQPSNKIGKSSSSKSPEQLTVGYSATSDSGITSSTDKLKTDKPATSTVPDSQTTSKLGLSGLGLAAYDSDDD